MTEWRRRSVRVGAAEYDGPHEGIPGHLQAPLHEWLHERFGWNRPLDDGGIDAALIYGVASAARIQIALSFSGSDVSDSLISHCYRDHEVFLDVLDATLHLRMGDGADDLRQILAMGDSVWTVADSGRELHRRVDGGAVKAKDAVLLLNSTASGEIAEAWRRVFSRDADPSDAWDHAAKAVEAALIPIIVPTQDKPHLGHVLGTLRNQRTKWQIVLPGADQSHSVVPLIGMLDLIWPNPDRHASDTRHTPTQEEAQAVVHLAIAIVQWAASGAVRAR